MHKWLTSVATITTFFLFIFFFIIWRLITLQHCSYHNHFSICMPSAWRWRTSWCPFQSSQPVDPTIRLSSQLWNPRQQGFFIGLGISWWSKLSFGWRWSARLLGQGHGSPVADQPGQGCCRQKPSPQNRRACYVVATSLTLKKSQPKRSPLLPVITHCSVCATLAHVWIVK